MAAIYIKETRPVEQSKDTCSGSVVDTVARLIRWGKCAPEGLARAEFSSTFLRQEVIHQIRCAFDASEIAFVEISLSRRKPALDVVRGLIEKLSNLENGVVSISGFETAFSETDTLADALRLINFNRENLARPALRQIWWMTTAFTDTFISAAPDLDSWFILRLSLTESSSRPDYWALLSDFEITSLSSIEEARNQSLRMKLRFDKAAQLETSSIDLWRLVCAALQPLVEYGAIREATVLYKRCIRTLRKLKLAIIPSDTYVLQNIADLQQKRGAYAEAESLYLRVISIRQQTLGSEHIDTLNSLISLGSLYSDQGRYDDAETLYFEVKKNLGQSLGIKHAGLIKTLSHLAVLYWRQGSYRKAELIYRKIKGMLERTSSEDRSFIPSIDNNLAVMYWQQGRFDEAEFLYHRTKCLSENLLGSEHPKTLILLNNIAILYSTQRYFDKAESTYIYIREIMERMLGLTHPNIFVVLNNLATLYSDLGRYDEAELLCIHVKENSEIIFGKEHPDTLRACNNLVKLYWRQARYDEAEAHAIDMLKRYEIFPYENSVILQFIKIKAFRVLNELGKSELVREWEERLGMRPGAPPA